MSNNWIEHVKGYAKEHGLKYNQALKEASSTYNTSKKMVGNGLKSHTFQKLLEASYSGIDEVEEFMLDKITQLKHQNIRASIRTCCCST